MPKYRRPFLVLAWNQTRGILGSPRGILTKFLLLTMLWLHVVLVNGVKAAFRMLDALVGKHTPKWFENLCAFAVQDARDIRIVAGPEVYRDYMPDGWPLRKIRR